MGKCSMQIMGRTHWDPHVHSSTKAEPAPLSMQYYLLRHTPSQMHLPLQIGKLKD